MRVQQCNAKNVGMSEPFCPVYLNSLLQVSSHCMHKLTLEQELQACVTAASTTRTFWILKTLDGQKRMLD